MASPATGHPQSPPSLSASDVMSKASSENFPVASRALPRAVRPHLLAVYGFARLVDDIGDEAEGDRLAQLDWADAELDRAATQIGGMMDPLHGGLRGAPKFPQAMMLEFLWRAGERTGEPRYFAAVERTLEHRIGRVARLGHAEHHREEVRDEAAVVFRVDVRKPAAVAVGERRDRGYLGD